MITDEIREMLFAMRDEEYRLFQAKLIPTVDPSRVIGVRTPALRKYAKECASRKDVCDFLRDLPHGYFDEDQLHAFIISQMKDPERIIEELNVFLPFVDNWATCDQTSPKALAKRPELLLENVRAWISSSHKYTVRFAIGMLMEHFLDDKFDTRFPEAVAGVKSEEYYVNMMRAWYFATALAKQYDATVPFIIKRRLDKWTHNKAIQKAIESFRVTPEHKAFLKTLKI